MNIILAIPIILSIFTASMFTATISNTDKAFAICKELSNEMVHCQEKINTRSLTSNTPTNTTSTASETEDMDEESSPLGGGLLGSSLGTFSFPLGDFEEEED